MNATVIDMQTYRESDEDYVYRKVQFALRGTNLLLVAAAQNEGKRRLNWGRSREDSVRDALAWASRQSPPTPPCAA